jgi:hypothetical protein
MSNEILCLYGAGGHGRVVASQALRSGWRDVVFTDAVVSSDEEPPPASEADLLVPENDALFHGLGTVSSEERG